MQGYTEAPFRHFHARLSGGADEYYTPFIRFEQGHARPKDMRDLTSPLNDNHTVVPQIIFKDLDEFRTLTDELVSAGFHRIDLNMGCPFPPQVNRGRGAGLLRRPDIIKQVVQEIHRRPEISFSVKMRPGIDNIRDWENILPLLNVAKLAALTVHPRLAANQYSGDLEIRQFERILLTSANPVIFNGDITTPDQIDVIRTRYPERIGIMVGRGLLMRPSIFDEYRNGYEIERAKLLLQLVAFHQYIFEYYDETLNGEVHLLQKMKPFWDYSEAIIGRRNWKAIKKSSSVPGYLAAVRNIII